MPTYKPTVVGEVAQDTSSKPRGRFAPSPTGDLHFGSLLAALASYCTAKSRSGIWRLRIDDIDGPRSVPGSAEAIQRTLEQYGFEWDGAIQWQSEQRDYYHQALAELVNRQLIFHCGCSRKSLSPGKIYPGACRDNTAVIQPSPTNYHRPEHALRCKLEGELNYNDAIQGEQTITLEKEVGDIIVWRRDKLVAYALACAVDDAKNVSHVVRGADLLGNTAGQIALMQALDLTVPEYAHIPVAIDANGDKLSKHSKAQPVSSLPALPTLLKAWRILGQIDIHPSSVSDFWAQAITHWAISSVPRVHRLQT